jgi:hypothetical protein
MHLISPITGPLSVPTSGAASAAAAPTPPARWSRWYTSPIAKLEYGAGSRLPLFPEARIAADRGLTGSRIPAVIYAGTTLDAAIAAARQLAARPVEVSFSYRNGRVGTVAVNPAFGVLRDARAGAFWLAPLETTVQLRGEWVDAPHTIDGPAFEGAKALLGTPTVLSATRDMVAVVGKETVLKPSVWTDAPDDSRLEG